MDDTRLHRASDSMPGRNHQFDRGWLEPVVTGPDTPAEPAHGAAWQAEDEPLSIAGSNHRNRRWRAAERAFAGDRGTGYRRGGS